jgi:hypothetical protein
MLEAADRSDALSPPTLSLSLPRSYYYYNYEQPNYESTLVSVKQEYAQLGLPLSYLMLDR